MKYLRSTLFFALTALSLVTLAQTDKATTAKIVAEKRYTFVANSAQPMSFTDVNRVMSQIPGAMPGGTINLTNGYYDLKVTPDSIVAYLPFYGRAFRAAYGGTDGGVKFTSTKFDYLQKDGKKGSYTINMQTKDAKDNYRMILDIGANGYATLSLNSNNKQNIIYNGILKENN